MSLLNPLSGIADVINSVGSIGKTAWDIYAQDKTWDREDNAVQRRMADLKAAGLNPNLAAGSAAQTSAPINVSAPQVSAKNYIAANEYDAAKKQQALTDAQIGLTEMNLANASASGFFDRQFALKLGEMQSDLNLRPLDQLIFGSVENKIATLEADTRAKQDALRNSDMMRDLGMPVSPEASQLISESKYYDALGQQGTPASTGNAMIRLLKPLIPILGAALK